jgi:opacity protein-like surface antigen
VTLPRPARISLLSGALALAVATASVEARAADDDAKESDDSGESAGDEAEHKTKTKADEDQPKDEKAKGDTTDFGHMGQLGLRAGLVGGFRMILRYSDSPFCRTPDLNKPTDHQVKFCGHTAPLAADFGLSFGVLDFFEPFAWARLGFSAESETDTKPLVVIGAGARLYTMSDAAFKIFIEPAVGLELEGGRGSLLWALNNPKYKQDFVFHVAAGPQLDFSRFIGAYLTAGLTAAFVRDLGASFDVSLGVQGRYP